MNPLQTCLAALLLLSSTAWAGDWPAWRGPLGNGVTEETDLPVKWSATENVKWRVALPGPGNSTPIVLGERVLLTQAEGDERRLMCFHRADGRLLWQSGVTATVKESTHASNPYCSASPVSDGERVIAFFGSAGLFCYDLQGHELWKRTDLGRLEHIWGSGPSPVVEGNICYLNFGPGETTYLAAFDKTTGKTLWKHDEETGYGKPLADDAPKGANPTFIGSWTTPVLTVVEGRRELLMSWPGRLAAYDPDKGDEVWTCAGLNPLAYTSPIWGEGIVVTMGGYGGSAMGVRAGGSGDITSSRRLWLTPRNPQRIGSGVIRDGYIYIHNDPGTAMCLELKTGQPVWTERLKGPGASGQNWSSVMLSGDNCYTITQGGDCFVFKASPKFELVSVNPLGERSNSSIVPSNGELFIRTHQALWCIGTKK